MLYRAQLRQAPEQYEAKADPDQVGDQIRQRCCTAPAGQALSQLDRQAVGQQAKGAGPARHSRPGCTQEHGQNDEGHDMGQLVPADQARFSWLPRQQGDREDGQTRGSENAAAHTRTEIGDLPRDPPLLTVAVVL